MLLERPLHNVLHPESTRSSTAKPPCLYLCTPFKLFPPLTPEQSLQLTQSSQLRQLLQYVQAVQSVPELSRLSRVRLELLRNW